PKLTRRAASLLEAAGTLARSSLPCSACAGAVAASRPTPSSTAVISDTRVVSRRCTDVVMVFPSKITPGGRRDGGPLPGVLRSKRRGLGGGGPGRAGNPLVMREWGP